MSLIVFLALSSLVLSAAPARSQTQSVRIETPAATAGQVPTASEGGRFEVTPFGGGTFGVTFRF